MGKTTLKKDLYAIKAVPYRRHMATQYAIRDPQGLIILLILSKAKNKIFCMIWALEPYEHSRLTLISFGTSFCTLFYFWLKVVEIFVIWDNHTAFRKIFIPSIQYL